MDCGLWTMDYGLWTVDCVVVLSKIQIQPMLQRHALFKKNSNFLNYWYYITRHLGAAPVKEYEKLQYKLLFFKPMHL